MSNRLTAVETSPSSVEVTHASSLVSIEETNNGGLLITVKPRGNEWGISHNLSSDDFMEEGLVIEVNPE